MLGCERPKSIPLECAMREARSVQTRHADKTETHLALRLEFKNIREHRGSQNGGFEELCCQLAALEDPEKGSSFIRKGPGPDQGLECYRTYADGHEVGWQAKYFINGFGDGQASDLNASLQRALKAHPRLSLIHI